VVSVRGGGTGDSGQFLRRPSRQNRHQRPKREVTVGIDHALGDGARNESDARVQGCCQLMANIGRRITSIRLYWG